MLAFKDFEEKILAALKQESGTVLKNLLEKHPDAFFATLRRVRPILQVRGGPVFVTLFDDVQEVLSRPEVFTVKGYATKMDPSVGPYMLARDGTTLNDRDKGIMRAMLRREDLPQVRQSVARLAAAAVRGSARDGRLEVVSDLARKVPIQLTGEYFGFPGPDLATMMRWSRATQHDMFHNLENDAAVHAANVQAGAEMRTYLSKLLEQRRAELARDDSADDTLARLLKSHFPDSIGFDDERVLANMMGLLVGGVETTSQAIVQILDQLLDRPEQLAALRAAAQSGDDNAVYDLCWEALRFNPINPFVVRVCVVDYVLASGTARATSIAPGTTVLASTRSAMRDEHELDDPEQFRPGRPDYHYMHMGYGLHTCLGDHVSTVQIPEVVKQLVLAANVSRVQGEEGRIDFQGGPFPERFVVAVGDPN